MCGFIGVVSKNEFDFEKLKKCNEKIICRGPDETKYLTKELECGKLYAIFNRLSIIDLNPNASQPMSDDEGNIILFNGEVFNHTKLRKQLEAENINFFTDHSDTELVLRYIGKKGIDSVKNFIGQFAIFYYSKLENKAYLIRDRLSQKPLYYSIKKNEIQFSSNLVSLIKLDDNFSISKQAISEYLYTGVVRSPNTIFENYHKLEPGQILEFNLNSQYTLKKWKFWEPRNFLGEEKFNDEHFTDLLTDAINLRQVADVDVANLLSGGLDSTSIISLINKPNKEKLNTFTVTNGNSKYDESNWANQVSEKYKTKHTNLEIKLELKIEEVNESIDIFDEPYADPSTIPSFFIYKKISEYFKVAISGDGGDELLGGYDRIYNTLKRNKSFSKLSELLFNYYPFWLGTGYNFLKNSSSLEKSYKSSFLDLNLKKILLNDSDKSEINLQLKNLDISEYKTMILFEYEYYLPEMMMLKVDKTSMANSLEIRSPFVDHRLVEYVLSSNLEYETQNNSKHILKNLLSEDFNNHFLNRKKQGFVIDLETWVFKNKQYILDSVSKSLGEELIDLNNFKKLFLIKSRVNSIRIWKVYFLSRYLKNLSLTL